MIQRPGLHHSLVGFITARTMIIVIGLCTGNMSVLYLVYNHWILEKMKATRDRMLAEGETSLFRKDLSRVHKFEG